MKNVLMLNIMNFVFTNLFVFRNPESVATVKSSKKLKDLGKELTKTLGTFCPELLFHSIDLLNEIHDYVFARENNQEYIESRLSEITGGITTFNQENLEFLLLAVKGTKMMVEENNLISATEYDEYILEKQLRVKGMIDARLRDKASEKRDTEVFKIVQKAISSVMPLKMKVTIDNFLATP